MLRLGPLLVLSALAACASDPLSPPGEWAFVLVEDSVCRDGSPTGIGVRLQPDSRDVVFVLDGGGVCFDAQTCADNRASYGRADFDRQAVQRGNDGIFETSPENPLGGWNAVFVPYCTGDVHGGTREDVAVTGVAGAQQFVGHDNVERALALVADRLGEVERVVVAGGSAGSYGAMLSVPAVVERFPDADLTLLADSGPVFFDDAVMSPDLSARFDALFGFSEAVPEAGVDAPDGFERLYDHLARLVPDADLGLVSYADDAVIRRYLSAGQRYGGISSPQYAAGLRDLQNRLPPPWDLLVLEGSGHVVIGTTQPFQTGGVADWLREAVGE